MTLQPHRPYIEVLRETLRTLESDHGPPTPDKSNLVRQIRQRIADIETVQRLTDARKKRAKPDD